MGTFTAIISTCRNPSPPVRSLANDLSAVIPNAYKITRGKMSVEALWALANERRVQFVVIIQRRHGGPGSLEFLQSTHGGLRWVPPRLIVGGYRLQRDILRPIGERRAGFKNVAIWTADEPAIRRIADALGMVFKLPCIRDDSVLTPHDGLMRVWLDEAYRVRLSFFSTSPKREVGPSLILKAVEWADKR